LSTTAAGGEEPDRFIYDPRNPVPTLGGNILMPMNYPKGPVNQQFLEEREDILIYRTRALEKDIEVTGPIIVKLYAASSARDTDFTAN
jgi:predicted acyl esterase